ncbi:MAG: prepilin peptidase [Bacteriovoracaceae bacterium]|nr:prepilin peptidase [Bacteriovoracaceae bacterium]
MYLLELFVFTFGAIFGSFLNVVIYRIPLGLNVARPRSTCPSCKKLIHWYENIPLLSYLALRGKCLKCKARIPFSYFIVELIAGAMALYLFPNSFSFETIIRFVVLFSTVCVFISHFFIDLKHKILPDVLNLYLAAIFLGYALLFYSWKHWAIGLAIGGGFPFLVSSTYLLFAKKEGLGLGDVKLFAALGIYLGPLGIITNVFLSCMLGSIVGVLLILTKKMSRDYPIPFGPFIILAASLQIFFPKIVKMLPLPF